MKESKCSECGEMFKDSAPNAPLILCLDCEMKAQMANKTTFQLSSDGGFGPRTHYGEKVAKKPFQNDEDMNRLKDED